MTRRLAVAWASAVLLGGFVVDLRLQPGGQRLTRGIDDFAQLVAAATAALTAAWRVRHEVGRMRLSWGLIGAGAGCWALGQSIWTYYEVIASTATPFPSLADVGYLMLPVLAMAGLLVRPSQAFGGRGLVRIGLDVLLVIASLFTVSWATALGEVYRGGADSTLARAVSLAYPAGDLALLTVVVTVIAYANAGGRFGLFCIGSGLAGLAVADSGFAYFTAIGTYHTGNLIDACWVGGFVVLAWAAVLDRATEWRSRGTRTPYTALLLPYLPAVLGIAFAVWKFRSASGSQLLLGAASLMVLVLLVRQIVVVLENANMADRMKHQAFHDSLTGLANRALFNDRLAHALEIRRRESRPLALLLIDLDDFKIVNDSLGHPAGDELLIEVGRRLRAAARAGDTVARLGGDEFAVLAEDIGQPADVATRVLRELNEPLHIGNREVRVSGSIGVAVLGSTTPTMTPTRMLQQADVAMYAAKRSGKGAVRIYSEAMSEVSGGHLDLRTALLADVANGRMGFALQPIYLADGRLYAVEALARWSHADESIAPNGFLPIARELGCIAALDEIVLRKAVAEVAAFDSLVLCVNVDSRTLAKGQFADFVLRTLRDVGMAPTRLGVEILELNLIEYDRAAMRTLTTLRDAGVRIVVDDFGTGYATLARLRTLRPDVLKIDGSLVAEIDTDHTAALLLDGAAQLGRQMGARVVAEGIETESQLRSALAAGCDAVQGYLLARPAAPDELPEIVRIGVPAPWSAAIPS